MNMKVAVAVVLGALTLPIICHAESLGDVAKREAERRKKVEETGKGSSPVVGETELRENKGTIANHSGAAPAVPADSPSVSSTSSSTQSSSSHSDRTTPKGASLDAHSGSEDEQNWRQRTAEAHATIEAARAEYNDALTKPKVPVGYVVVDENGKIEMDAVEANQRALQKAKAQLDAAEAALTRFEEEARRAGVPPGWLR
jgi:hypothetical protein